ncbi:MAG: endonuclease, partial [Algicola sp.]|nr:endonuclease [Algicola sp.]
MIKHYALALLLFLGAFNFGFGQSIWINEIHYDNEGTDTNECIEIAGQSGTDLSNFSLVFYNGNGGIEYDNVSLNGIITNQSCGYGTIEICVSGIQNGAPDGIALCDGSNVIQFLSYEGVMTAVDGLASGMTSTDIGESEGSSTPVGYSLQLSGTGTDYSDFVWQPAATETFGSINLGQSFCVCTPPTDPNGSISGTTPVCNSTTLSYTH